MHLSDPDKRCLLEIARRSIECAVRGEDPPAVKPDSEDLRQARGAFVTLHRHGELRGCIGFAEALRPLAETVSAVAAKAAVEDPRFEPVIEEELDEVEVEVSVLSPLRRITNVEEIEVGKHGLVIERDYFRGLLLPQVAEQYRWDRETFLEFATRKAGLPNDAWKEAATSIYVFTAEVFHDRT